MSPTANTSGWPGSVRSGSTAMRPARSSSAPLASASLAASGDACTPAAQIVVWASIRDVLPSASVTSTPAASTPTTRAAHAQLDAEPLELLWPPCRRAGRRRSASGSLPPSTQHHPDRRRVERAELASEQRTASSRTWPASSTPVGPAPTMTMVSQCAARRRRVGDLGHLEGAEDPPAQLEGVVDRLHARRVAGPARRGRSTTAPAPAATMRLSYGSSSGVEARGAGGVDDPAVEVEAGHLGQLDADVLVRAARRGGSAARSGRARACPWPPGRGAAGTGGGCAGRPA